jgi:hypothetical protein
MKRIWIVLCGCLLYSWVVATLVLAADDAVNGLSIQVVKVAGEKSLPVKIRLCNRGKTPLRIPTTQNGPNLVEERNGGETLIYRYEFTERNQSNQPSDLSFVTLQPDECTEMRWGYAGVASGGFSSHPETNSVVVPYAPWSGQMPKSIIVVYHVSNKFGKPHETWAGEIKSGF